MKKKTGFKDFEILALCKSCGCMTKRKKGYIYICGKCGKDRRGETKSPLRSFEYLQERKCLLCKKPFVAMHYWSHAGKELNFDHWVISSVYCSTTCARAGRKKIKEAIIKEDLERLKELSSKGWKGANEKI